jgi:nicotinamide mononucleotide (NMN) deamidase PncC
MAENGLRILDVDVCISLTGNAGPSALEGKPVGLVYIGLSIKERTTIVQKYKFQGNRQEIRDQAVQAAIDLIYTHLLDTK